VLARARAALPRPESLADPGARELATRLQERISRDLLPRLCGEGPVLLVAIAGPNNVGKSSLFNALVGRPLSPARAEGGLTKQCLAAANPSLWSGELRELVERRYDVRRVGPEEVPVVEEPGPAGRLYLALVDEVPPGLLLLDTPDFDSVYLQNRVNSEALLVTVDLVVFVVSRQTYQNAALVRFLEAAVGRGRPYLLVYNEATRAENAEAHLAKLAKDVGTPPLARFFAWHQPEVEAGRALLETRPLGGGPSLPELLGNPSHAAALKAKALEASLRDAARELSALSSAIRSAAAEAERLRTRIRHELSEVGARAAVKAVPADVLLLAFREELDARSAFHKWVRMPFRALAGALGFAGRKVRDAVAGPPAPNATVAALTEQTLKDGLRRAVDALGPEIAAWRGEEKIRELLSKALGKQTLFALDAPLRLEAMRGDAEDRRKLHDFCRQLISKELVHGGDLEFAVQTLATLIYSAPAGAAAAITVATGGFGHDAVVWAASALSTPLFEKLVDLLGSSIRARVTREWAEAHGATLAKSLERRFFAPLLEALDAQVAEAEREAGELDAAREVVTS